MLVAAVTWWPGHCFNVCKCEEKKLYRPVIGSLLKWWHLIGWKEGGHLCDSEISWKYELMIAPPMLNAPAPIQWHTNNTSSLVNIGYTFMSFILCWGNQIIWYNLYLRNLKILFYPNSIIFWIWQFLEAWTALSPARHSNVQVEGQDSLLASPGRGDNIQMKIPRFCHINCNNNQIILKIFDDNNNMSDCCYFNVYIFININSFSLTLVTRCLLTFVMQNI